MPDDYKVAKWQVTRHVDYDLYDIVADTEEEAIEIAENTPLDKFEVNEQRSEAFILEIKDESANQI